MACSELWSDDSKFGLSFGFSAWLPAGRAMTRRGVPPGSPVYSLRAPAVLVIPAPVAGPLGVPDPVPIVSPVVPLFIAPLLMPAPGLGRSVRLEPLLAGLPVAGEMAESPDAALEPVLAFCASANELVKTNADTVAINEFFISIS